MKSAIVYYFVKIILQFFSLLPLAVNHTLGKYLGLCLYFFNTQARKISKINIQTCLPDLSVDKQQQLVKNSLIEFGKNITEIGPLWLWKTDKLFQYLQVEGQELIQTAINNNKGVILITPHLGCWEMAGLYVGKQWSCSNLYQAPKIKSLEPIIRSARERSGADLVATGNRGLGALLKSLRAGKVTGILPDQTPKDKANGTFAPFFGRPALTINLLSSLARKSQAEVFMCFAQRLSDGKGYVLRFQKTQAEIDNKDNLISATALNQSVEQLIKQAPEQYLWSYKRFKQVADGLQEIY
jgi:Kdo2-lipid IVA lauroyltransferase/acyltransferase